MFTTQKTPPRSLPSPSPSPSRPAKARVTAADLRKTAKITPDVTARASALAAAGADEPRLRRTPEIYKSGIRVVVPEKRRADGMKSNRLKVIAIFLDRKDAEGYAKTKQDAKVRD